MLSLLAGAFATQFGKKVGLTKLTPFSYAETKYSNIGYTDADKLPTMTLILDLSRKL